MPFHADLHVHSKYSRATSRDCDLEHLAWWARRKGVTVLGTGDFTHPGWFEHLKDTLVPAEPGLFRLGGELERAVDARLPASCRGPVRFMLCVEISTIYKRAAPSRRAPSGAAAGESVERTRKVHHLVYVPDLDAAAAVNRALGRIGNLASDGRPILGLDSRDLLEIVLSSGEGSYLVPAHVWTPWFAALGSKSGFDRVEDCYADLAEHVFALETGLSSDPSMNRRVSALDRYRLVSNSDLHSPPAMAREATVFDTAVDYFAIRRALETGEGLAGTVEFFPEEGKYHLDGHRRCGVVLEPAQTRRLGGLCPACGKPLTVGVLHRVEELADRPDGARPPGAPRVHNLVPLPEILGELLGVGARSKAVTAEAAALADRLGPELGILTEVPLDDIRRVGSGRLAEAIGRLRRGEVRREAGFDGEYGVIRMFDRAELDLGTATAVLFEAPAAPERPAAGRGADAEVPAGAGGPQAPGHAAGDGAAGNGAAGARTAGSGPAAGSPLAGLDAEQREAVTAGEGPLLIVAGPGTGKTRTLTARIAHVVRDRGVPAERCLAITFTRRAAEELRSRLRLLAPEAADRVAVATFHAFGLEVVREQHDRLGLAQGVQVAGEEERVRLARALGGGSDRQARRLLERVAQARRAAGEGGGPAALAEDREAAARYEAMLRERGLVDLDDLVVLPVRLLSGDPALAARYRERHRWVFVDEYQDVDEAQYRLLRLLTGADGNLCAIGDPDQAIYGFRGADVGFFLRFGQDWPGVRTVRLVRNYRSSRAIVRAAGQVIAPATLVPDRVLEAVAGSAAPARVTLHRAASEQAEAAFVARTIDGLLGGSSFHSIDSGRADGAEAALCFADVAVLYRTDAQAAPLVEAFAQAGIPFQKRSHDRLLDQPGVRAIVGVLRGELARGPAVGGAVADRVRAAARTVAHGGDAQALASLELLAPLAERCGEDLGRFVDELALGAEVDLLDPRADRVSLLTLHAAKGLEFPVVFLVGCEDGLLPLRFVGRDAPGGDAEERRLLFVGMTRARVRLLVSGARRRLRQGAVRQTGPSPFLADIDPALLDDAPPPAAARRRVPAGDQLRLL
ncbi:MAG TPA: UvrD-helicase domain-containing protein [Actinomycetes bacterium]|nr:UvrD-helicase domain-containing protein [Actinomycetes bacterium]